MLPSGWMTAENTIVNFTCAHTIAIRPFFAVTATSYSDGTGRAGGASIWSVETIVPSVATRHSLIPDRPAVTTMKSLPTVVTAYESLMRTGNTKRFTIRPVRSYVDTAIAFVGGVI